MLCKNCSEENSDEAVFCKNCGEKLKEEVKKTEIIEKIPQTNQKNNTTFTHQSKSGGNLAPCCLCIIGIFIIFAILGSILHI